MADNTTLNSMSGGDTIATDSLGGTPEIKVQVEKIMLGSDGQNDGTVSSSNPMPVGSDNSYEEDSVHSSGDKGSFVLAVRKDTPTSLSGTDGDYTGLIVDSSNRLYSVTRPDDYAVDDSSMPATPRTVPVSGEYRSSPTTYSDGDTTVLQSDVNGYTKVVLQTGGNLAGRVQITDPNNSYRVDVIPDDTTMPATPGTVPVSGEYRATPTTYSDGDATVLQTDVNGNLKTVLETNISGEDNTNNVLGTLTKPVANSAYAADNSKDAGSVTKASVKATAGNVYSIRITNANAAVRYFQFHNKASAPAGGDTALRYYLIPAGTATQPTTLELNSNYFSPSVYFSTGVAWAISTTATTFTDSATASEHTVDLNYK